MTRGVAFYVTRETHGGRLLELRIVDAADLNGAVPQPPSDDEMPRFVVEGSYRVECVLLCAGVSLPVFEKIW